MIFIFLISLLTQIIFGLYKKYVVYTETNGVDFTYLISPLTEIMLDRTKRTVKGVFEIIQRGLIVNCDPFSTRLEFIMFLFSNFVFVFFELF